MEGDKGEGRVACGLDSAMYIDGTVRQSVSISQGKRRG